MKNKKINEMGNEINMPEEEFLNEGICNVVDNEAEVAEEVLESINATENDTTTEETTTEDAPAEEVNDIEELTEMGAESKSEDIEQLLVEAEARGYERGRNERIETWLNEGRSKIATATSKEPESEIMILNNMRKSVWE